MKRSYNSDFYKHILAKQVEKKSKYDEEKSKLELKVTDKFQEREYEIGQKKLKVFREENALLHEKVAFVGALYGELGNAPDLEPFLELENIAMNGPRFYPCEDNSFVEVLKELMKEDYNPDESDIIAGLTSSDMKAFSEFLRQHIKIYTDKATFRYQGRVKGYKGDETHMKPNGEPPECEGTKPGTNTDWSSYDDEEIKREEIDWPDYKSTMAYAKIKRDVIIVEFKDDEEEKDIKSEANVKSEANIKSEANVESEANVKSEANVESEANVKSEDSTKDIKSK
jgi:hypothetical protein